MRARLRFGHLCLVACTLTALAGSVSAQTPSIGLSSLRTEPDLDPKKAQALGFIPGFGHLYATEYAKGAGLAAGTFFGLVVGAAVFELNDCSFAIFEPCDPSPQTANLAIGSALMIGGVWCWITSVVDAPSAARRTNKARHQLGAILTPPVNSNRAWHVGLRLTH